MPIQAKRILVVDDEPVLCMMTARALRECGHEVVEATDGMAAYQLARVQHFDLVVTDSRMPGLEGPDLVAWLRIMNPSLPILHITGKSAADPTDMPSDVPTLFKPFNICDLVKEAEKLLAISAD